METKIAVFKGKSIRKTIFNNEWWFSIIDIVEVLTGSQRPRKYWNDLKKKLLSEGYVQLSEKIGQLKLPSTDGKLYETDCANTETLFRIVQSIPSPKAEPFKEDIGTRSFIITFFFPLSALCSFWDRGTGHFTRIPCPSHITER